MSPLIDLQRGTSESAWRDSSRLRQLEELHLDLTGTIVALAPHPDDETLGVGGTLHLLARATEATIRIIALTDGEASHPNSTTHTPHQLGALRAREQTAAITALGVRPDSVIRLNLADGALMQTTQLDALLSPLIADASCCLAPYPYDGHPDHDAAGAAATRVARTYGVTLWTYPIWAWNWADPENEQLPWSNARRVSLDAAAQCSKACAIQAYHSQLAPLSPMPGDDCLLSPNTLKYFARNYEVLFV